MKKFFYRVQKTDTVLSLAKRFGISCLTIISKNNLNAEITEGDILYIEKEPHAVYSVKPCDTLKSVAEKFGMSKAELSAANGNISYIFYGLKVYIP